MVTSLGAAMVFDDKLLMPNYRAHASLRSRIWELSCKCNVLGIDAFRGQYTTGLTSTRSVLLTTTFQISSKEY
jgi:hypothetical protein